MIEEDYVSFETAKLLKEKEFECAKGSITAMYNENGIFHSLCTSEPNGYYYDYDDFDEHDYIAPTLQMAMKWLREKHKITIGILFSFKEDRIYYEIQQNNEYVFGIDTPESYAKVCDEAIKYCLKLIKND